jgi:hypothetical protein
VRYPTGANRLWKWTPLPEHDAAVGDLVTSARELAGDDDRAAVRAVLSTDEVGVLLTYCRRLLIGATPDPVKALDALLLIDIDRPGMPRDDIKVVAALTLGVLPRRDESRAASGAVEHATTMAAEPGGRVPALYDLGYRYAEVAGIRLLLRDLHPDRHYSPWADRRVLELAELAEFKGYEVESITIKDDWPDLIRDDVHARGDMSLAGAMMDSECGTVRCGPRPGGRTGRLTIHLMVSLTEKAEILAAAANRLSTDEAPILARTIHGCCVILVSDGSDDLSGYEFVIRALREGSEIGSLKPHLRLDSPVPVDPDQHTMLVMDVNYGDGSPGHQWWLAGPPAHGTHPDPEGAWRALSEADDPFLSFDMYTEEYHGPERATVRGFWQGRWVDRFFHRASGEAVHWDAVKPFFQPENVPVKEIVTYLEMTDRGRLLPADPVPGLALEPLDRDSPLVVELQVRVGAPHGWKCATRTAEEWTTWFAQRPDRQFWQLTFEGEPAGFVAYDIHPGNQVEIETFGLVPEFVGRGLGGYALTLTLAKAWGLNPGVERIWLHTSSADHPNALPNYHRRGLRAFKTEEGVRD